MTDLALLGGDPVRDGGWPRWPTASPTTSMALDEVLQSGRWAISGPSMGRPSFNERFTRAFAQFHDVPFAVGTASGSAALRVALMAVGVEYGDEVIVPGLTWVACASAVLAVGAVPVFVDIDPSNLCLSPERVREAITNRTRAVLVVHSLCSVARLDEFVALTAEQGIPLIEDCAQAHGARCAGRRVGTFGCLGVFSMQQTKVLTSGEGGAVVTSSGELADRIEQLRADGRRDAIRAPAGTPGLHEVGDVQGYNFCLSEFQCALLLDGLSRLNAENAVRAENASLLSGRIDSLPYARPLRQPSNVDAVTYYQYCFRIDLAAFEGIDVKMIGRAVAAELGLPVGPIHCPVPSSVLYRPLLVSHLPLHGSWRSRLDPARFDLPEARAASAECLAFPHQGLLGDAGDLDDVVAALEKVQRHAGKLQRHAGERTE